MARKPRKQITEMIEELKSWLPNYDHGPLDYPTLVWRILAGMPGGAPAAAPPKGDAAGLAAPKGEVVGGTAQGEGSIDGICVSDDGSEAGGAARATSGGGEPARRGSGAASTEAGTTP